MLLDLIIIIHPPRAAELKRVKPQPTHLGYENLVLKC